IPRARAAGGGPQTVGPRSRTSISVTGCRSNITCSKRSSISSTTPCCCGGRGHEEGARGSGFGVLVLGVLGVLVLVVLGSGSGAQAPSREAAARGPIDAR